MSDQDARQVTFARLARPVRRMAWLAGLLSALGAIASVLPVVFAVELARAALPTMDGEDVEPGRLWVLAGLLVVTMVAGSLVSAAGYAVSHAADARLSEHLRQRQITHLLNLPLEWFWRASSGQVKKVVQDDVAKTHQIIAHTVPDLTRAATVPIVSLGYLFWIDWRVGLIALIPLTACVLTFPFMMRDVEAQFERYDAALGGVNTAIVEFVRGIGPIKMFGAAGHGYRRFAERSDAFARAYLQWVQATVRASAFLAVFSTPAFAIAVCGLGTTLLIVHTEAEPLVLLPALLLSANIAGPLLTLAQMSQFLSDANGAARELAEFFDLPARPEPGPSGTPAHTGVAFHDVGFSYRDGLPALSDIRAAAEPGTTTALVGPSGSGKSTLAALAPRLLDPDDGSVAVGGVRVDDLAAVDLYRQVGFVFQQPFLMRMSIRDNIALARPDAGDDEVRRAAQAAHIHDRIMALPRRYASVVGEDAVLSGGERQRLSIARALLMDTPILVLDEATAFADPDSEAEIQRGIAELTRGRTLLVIAHRLHTIVDAEQILVLDAGHIVERGTHDDLIASAGLYARMWQAYQRAQNLAEPTREDS